VIGNFTLVSLAPSLPLKRITASDTLNHPFFWSEGGTCQSDSLPRISYRIEAAHEYETQKKRAEESSRRHPPQQTTQPSRGGGGGRGQGPPNGPPAGRGRSKYRIVTKPSAPSVTEAEPPPLVPAVAAPPEAPPSSAANDMVVPEHQSAFKKLGS
jgi:hypothetical protein